VETIKDTIEIVIQDLLAKKGDAKNNTPNAWLRKALTKKELGHIKFHYFRKGILGVIIDSSAWLYSLNLKKESLLNKLKNCSRDIKEIRFSIGDIK